MKILTRPIILLIAVWCVAVMLVPSALAADLGQGSRQQAGPGHMPAGQGNDNQMQAPPSGGSGQQGSQNNGEDRQMRERPSGDMSGNVTAPAGHGSMNGNGTMTRPDFGNMTAPALNGDLNGNGTMTRPDFGNMTRPDFGNTTMSGYGNRTGHEMNAWQGPSGNSTAPGPMPGNQSVANQAGRPVDNTPGNNQQNARSGTQAAGQGQQASFEEQINSIISQLQSLLSGGK